MTQTITPEIRNAPSAALHASPDSLLQRSGTTAGVRNALWVPAVNAMLSSRVRSSRDRADQILAGIEAAAVRHTRADGPVDEGFRAGMRVLLAAYLEVDELTPLGLFGVKTEIRRRVEMRLRVRRLLAEHPEIEDVPVRQPVVITGLPRTGTTFLHDMISCSESVRAPRLWELLRPCPADGSARLRSSDRRRRIRSARVVTGVAHSAVPGLRVVHDISARATEECVFMLPHSLVHNVPAPIPAYRRWYADRDATADYAYFKQLLQVLQWRCPERRWVLKSPFHLWSLDALLTVFPDATVIWTHRAPETVMASWCSLVEHIRALHTCRTDPLRVGREWLRIWDSALRRAACAREMADPERFCDVDYQALTGDPAAVVASLAERLGISAPRVLAPRHQPDQRTERLGRHRYSLERYGLRVSEVRERLCIGRPSLAAR